MASLQIPLRKSWTPKGQNNERFECYRVEAKLDEKDENDILKG